MSANSEDRTNIALIGMPGVGKSTIGVLLAKASRRGFIDTDVMIQAREQMALQDILDQRGLEEFCRLEERHILTLSLRRHVIATGGSVVYGQSAMESLRRQAVIIWLDLPLAELHQRLVDISTRGVVMAAGTSLAKLYQQRLPLYRKWAEITVNCSGRSQARIVDEIIEHVDGRPRP